MTTYTVIHTDGQRSHGNTTRSAAAARHPPLCAADRIHAVSQQALPKRSLRAPDGSVTGPRQSSRAVVGR